MGDRYCPYCGSPLTILHEEGKGDKRYAKAQCARRHTIEVYAGEACGTWRFKPTLPVRYCMRCGQKLYKVEVQHDAKSGDTLTVLVCPNEHYMTLKVTWDNQREAETL